MSVENSKDLSDEISTVLSLTESEKFSYNNLEQLKNLTVEKLKYLIGFNDYERDVILEIIKKDWLCIHVNDIFHEDYLWEYEDITSSIPNFINEYKSIVDANYMKNFEFPEFQFKIELNDYLNQVYNIDMNDIKEILNIIIPTVIVKVNIHDSIIKVLDSIIYFSNIKNIFNYILGSNKIIAEIKEKKGFSYNYIKLVRYILYIYVYYLKTVYLIIDNLFNSIIDKLDGDAESKFTTIKENLLGRIDDLTIHLTVKKLYCNFSYENIEHLKRIKIIYLNSLLDCGHCYKIKEKLYNLIRLIIDFKKKINKTVNIPIGTSF